MDAFRLPEICPEGMQGSLQMIKIYTSLFSEVQR